MEKEVVDNRKKRITLIKILAVLEIIFSSYKLLSTLAAGIILLIFSRGTFAFIETEGNNMLVYIITLSSLGLIISILALISAIGILCWKDWARQLMIWVAAGAIAVNLTSPFLSYVIGNQTYSRFGPFSSSSSIYFSSFSIIPVALSVAYNSFILWYFNRTKTKLIFKEKIADRKI